MYTAELLLLLLPRQGSRLAGQEKVPWEKRKTEPVMLSSSCRADKREDAVSQREAEVSRMLFTHEGLSLLVLIHKKKTTGGGGA